MLTPLLLGQLVYTSFAAVGFKSVFSTKVPPEIQQAFIQQVVYQYWDSYSPPSAGYRAAYLHQVTSEDSLFGWLYNDGIDDFGRCDVPYFVCYYLAGQLQPIQLENIFICLRTGPVTLIDRQNLPVSLENLVTSDLWSYEPAVAGVEIPKEIIEQSQIALQQEELLNLFVGNSEEKIQNISANKTAFADTNHQKNRLSEQANLTIQSAEDYRQILLAKASLQDTQAADSPADDKLILMLGIVASITFLFALTLGGYYFREVIPFAATVQKVPDSIPTQNPNLDPKKLILAKTLTSHSDSVWSIILTSNGKTLASASADKTIKVSNLDTGKIVSTLAGHNDTVRAIALSSDEQILVSGSGDKTIKIWDFQTGKLMRTITPNSVPVWSVAISDDGQTLVSGHEDGSVKMWHLHTGKLLRTIAAHESRVFSLAISPDEKTFVTGGLDKTMKIWNLHTGELLRTIAQHDDAVRSVIFSRDGQTLASASWDKTIKIWNLHTGELLHTLVGHTSRVVTLSMGLDGQTLASGSIDNNLKIWSWQTGKLLYTLSGHSDWILAIATNPSQQMLVSSSKDQTIRIWQPKIKEN